MADDKNTNPPNLDPEDEENIVIDTTSTEPLREAQIEPTESEKRKFEAENPDRGKFVSPRFGSAGSGGAEYEPGPPDRGRDIA
ncbi:MAG TPA: hypothetical protein VFS56_02325 [Gemmatimonadaceae bacterium]|nr:hypothetical protein [Gemmatimonadaceae bacterium]